MDEQKIIDGLKIGDMKAKEFFVRKYQNLIYNAIFQVLRDRDLSMDVLEETFIRAFKYIKGFRGESELSTWLYRIAMNTLKDEAKKASRHNTIDENAIEDKTPPEYALDDKKKMIWDALERIEEGDREVIALVDIKGLSYENASLLLGIPVNTLRSRLFRAREKLRLELGREEFF